MKQSKFIIRKNSSISDALKKIDSNSSGFVLVESKEKIIGVLTDGDVRRRLLDGLTLQDKIDQCINTSFSYAIEGDSRESIIKQLDGEVHFIPLLDKKFKLIKIFTKKDFPIDTEKSNIARARAPVRISFGGGGSDVTNYFSKNTGAVINATISFYSHAVLSKRDDQKIIVRSADLNEIVQSDDVQGFLDAKTSLSLIQSIIKIIDPKFGFELDIFSDYPNNSGLGGSAAISAAVLGCFNEFKNDKWDSYELSEIAFQAERLDLEIAGGWQDQYACTFGGINFIEFKNEQNIINPLRLFEKTILELESNLVLCDTGVKHDSGDIHQDQKSTLTQNEDIEKLVQLNVQNTYEIKNMLLKGRLNNFGELLGNAWGYKQQFSSKISSPEIDKLYTGALENGASGGKLLGAGGGGFFLFYSSGLNKSSLITYLQKNKLNIYPIKFDSRGMQSWQIRL
jgi:D-glycero-alpha-D-manno-heptose-7-phosphate kinase